jgi:hypothetical protein
MATARPLSALGKPCVTALAWINAGLKNTNSIIDSDRCCFLDENFCSKALLM